MVSRVAWVIYGKSKTSRCRFMPIDVVNGKFVHNIIYASFWNNDEKEEAVRVLNSLIECNRDYIFELRKR